MCLVGSLSGDERTTGKGSYQRAKLRARLLCEVELERLSLCISSQQGSKPLPPVAFGLSLCDIPNWAISTINARQLSMTNRCRVESSGLRRLRSAVVCSMHLRCIPIHHFTPDAHIFSEFLAYPLTIQRNSKQSSDGGESGFHRRVHKIYR